MMTQSNFAEPFFKYLSLEYAVSTKTLTNNFRKDKDRTFNKAKPYFLLQLLMPNNILIDLGVMTVNYTEKSNLIKVNTSTWNYDDNEAYWAPLNKQYNFNLTEYGLFYFMVRESNMKKLINLCIQYKELYTLEILMDNVA